jgi:23S rRNA (guanosine2251-2'-O)-methyltransferase
LFFVDPPTFAPGEGVVEPSTSLEHLEGRASVIAAIDARRRTVHEVLVAHDAKPDKIADVLDAAARAKVPVRRVTMEEIEKLAHGRTHGGVLAACSTRPLDTEADLWKLLATLKEPPLLLVLDGVDDPRNLGLCLRAGEALGVHAVLLRRRAWDFDAVEVSRPSSGAFERMTLVLFDGVELLQKLKVPKIACLAGAVKTIHEADLAGPAAIVVGGEKRGISAAVRAVCDRRMRIPSRPGAASLPLTHAAAVVLAEAQRQRLKLGK